MVDVSRQSITEKFSFIYTLNLSGSSNLDRRDLNPVTNQSAFTQQKLAAKSASSAKNLCNSDSSALATPDEATSTITAQWYQMESSEHSYNLDLSAIAVSCDTAAVKKPSQSSGNYLSKILLVGSCSYMMLTLWWLFGHHSEYLLAVVGGKQNIVLSKSDAKFLDYMERSLAAIDTQGSQQDEDVVYVPVFTPPTSTPSIQLPPTAIAAAPSPSSASLQETLKVPSPPPLPAPTPMAELAQPVKVSDPKTATTTANQPKVEHTLIGILELGDRSAALFKIEGTTEQIWQGQEIDNSGWTLDSVNDREVQISYQGEVRNLSVGEKF